MGNARILAAALAISWALVPRRASAQEVSLPPPGELKKLSLEQLMELEVTLVSRKPQQLQHAPSAIQVITREDLRRSGVTTLAEAMRLASNLHVARLNSTTYAISARGFNSSSNTLPNKLLVMIDGRTVYTPLYSGVFWDAQQVILDNVDRIEVVSGPGGSVWGTNAVNGVINIVTLPAAETRGFFVEGGVGTFLERFAGVRLGGRAGPALAWRVYGQHIDHGPSDLADSGRAAEDPWDHSRGGLRLDWSPSDRDRVTVQGEASRASTEQAIPTPDEVDYDGQFAQARWNHAFSPTSDFQVKAYFDRTWRDIPNTLAEELLTFDAEAFHTFAPLAGNQLLWGAGYRYQIDDVENPAPVVTAIQVHPARKTLPLASLFLQDQQDLLGDRLRLILGARLEHNVYTGWEYMPSGRAAFSFLPGQTLWAAISRAVRSTGRLDVEAFTPPPALVNDSTPAALQGGPDLVSEKLHAYELGYRLSVQERAALSAAAFVHSYEDLRILEAVSQAPLRFRFTNGRQGEVYGVELSGSWQAASWWRLRGGYTYLLRDLYPIAGHVEFPQPGNLGNDPAWQLQLQSFVDLPRGFELNATLRWLDGLPAPEVPGYAVVDLGAGWRWKGLEISVFGRNLGEESHAEARVASALPAQAMPMSAHARLAWRM